MSLTQKRGKKEDLVIINAETFRIRRSGDKRCFIYEEFIKGYDKGDTKVSDHWHTVGYYGQLSDLVLYLTNRHIETPEGTLQTQMIELLNEIKRVEKSILKQLEECAKGEI